VPCHAFLIFGVNYPREKAKVSFGLGDDDSLLYSVIHSRAAKAVNIFLLWSIPIVMKLPRARSDLVFDIRGRSVSVSVFAATGEISDKRWVDRSDDRFLMPCARFGFPGRGTALFRHAPAYSNCRRSSVLIPGNGPNTSIQRYVNTVSRP